MARTITTSKKIDKWSSYKSVRIYPIRQTWINAKNEALGKLKTDKGDAYNKLCIEIYNRMYKDIITKS